MTAPITPLPTAALAARTGPHRTAIQAQAWASAMQESGGETPQAPVSQPQETTAALPRSHSTTAAGAIPAQPQSGAEIQRETTAPQDGVGQQLSGTPVRHSASDATPQAIQDRLAIAAEPLPVQASTAAEGDAGAADGTSPHPADAAQKTAQEQAQPPTKGSPAAAQALAPAPRQADAGLPPGRRGASAKDERHDHGLATHGGPPHPTDGTMGGTAITAMAQPPSSIPTPIQPAPSTAGATPAAAATPATTSPAALAQPTDPDPSIARSPTSLPSSGLVAPAATPSLASPVVRHANPDAVAVVATSPPFGHLADLSVATAAPSPTPGRPALPPKDSASPAVPAGPAQVPPPRADLRAPASHTAAPPISSATTTAIPTTATTQATASASPGAPNLPSAAQAEAATIGPSMGSSPTAPQDEGLSAALPTTAGPRIAGAHPTSGLASVAGSPSAPPVPGLAPGAARAAPPPTTATVASSGTVGGAPAPSSAPAHAATPAITLAVPLPSTALTTGSSGAESAGPATGPGLGLAGSGSAPGLSNPPHIAGAASASGMALSGNGPTSLTLTVASAVPPPSAQGGQDAGMPNTASALAATVIALSQSGQSSTVLHLAPASLGALSVHVALAGDATVNVVFVPTVPQTAQLIHGALQDLHHALAGAGLSLGQAQIGGGAGGQAQGQEGGQSRYARTAPSQAPVSETDTAGRQDGLRGARAVA